MPSKIHCGVRNGVNGSCPRATAPSRTTNAADQNSTAGPSCGPQQNNVQRSCGMCSWIDALTLSLPRSTNGVVYDDRIPFACRQATLTSCVPGESGTVIVRPSCRIACDTPLIVTDCTVAPSG